MTSIIMVTDLSDSEVEEKAEGYGILGNINRNVPAENLFSLLEPYEKISNPERDIRTVAAVHFTA
jgi:hypothetical protein